MWFIARHTKLANGKADVKFLKNASLTEYLQFSTSDVTNLYIQTCLEHKQKELKCKFVAVWLNDEPVQSIGGIT